MTKFINKNKKLTGLKACAIVATFLVLLSLLIACGSSGEKVRIAVEGAYPPFSETKDDGNVVGFDIDIAAALCEAADVVCENVTQEWDGMIPGLLAKKYDAIIASMSITDERKEKVNFTKKYYSTTASFVAPVTENYVLDFDVEANKEDLAGKTIGVQEATVSDNYITDNYGDIATIKRYQKQEEVNLDLINGRIDLMFADTVVADTGLLQKEQGSKFSIVSPGYADPEWFGEGIGVAVRKEDNDLLEKLNKAIDEIRGNGMYDEIQANYFDYDIYGDE